MYFLNLLIDRLYFSLQKHEFLGQYSSCFSEYLNKYKFINFYYSSEGSIWDVAVSQLRKKKSQDIDAENDQRQATLIFIGSRGAVSKIR